MHFLYFTRFKITKIVQNPDWYNIKKIPFLTLYLNQNLNKISEKFTIKFHKFSN